MQVDFLEDNNAKKLENSEKKKHEESAKYKEDYKYFPYTNGESIEQKRQELKAKQQREFQSHLRKIGMASSGSSQFSQTGSHFHKISPLNDNLTATIPLFSNEKHEDGRINMQTFLETMQPDKNALIESKAPVKTFFDHGYNKRNKMVIYDDDPRIEAVMKQALDRHKA